MNPAPPVTRTRIGGTLARTSRCRIQYHSPVSAARLLREARAAARITGSRATNVLLIHGDAHHLPIASASVRRVNCSGGFHAFPDLPRALREIARISAPGAVLTASMFAENPRHQHPRLRELLRVKLGLHFVPLLWLGEQLGALGYTDYVWSVPKGGFSYTSAVKGPALH